MAALSRPIRVGVHDVQLTSHEYGRFDPPGSLDGLVMCQVGTEQYAADIAVRMALAVLTLAAEHPELMAQHQAAVERLRMRVVA